MTSFYDLLEQEMILANEVAGRLFQTGPAGIVSVNVWRPSLKATSTADIAYLRRLPRRRCHEADYVALIAPERRLQRAGHSYSLGRDSV